jgi:sugar lactone lactonase YvrE
LTQLIEEGSMSKWHGRLALAAGLMVLAPAAYANPPQVPRITVGDHQPVFPESITSGMDGTIYTSSVGLGVIFKAAPGATTATAWTQKATQGPQSILGVRVQPTTGLIWACYSDMKLSKGNTGQPAILRAIDLNTGKVKQSYTMPAESFCNDMAFGQDGSVYVTDTHNGQILRIAKGSNQLAKLFADDQLKGVDGIAFGPHGALYLTNVKTNKILRLSLDANGKPGKLDTVKLTGSLKSPDGLRPGADGVLYVAENSDGQVDLLRFNNPTAAVVEPVAGGFTGPTGMTQHGDTLYVTAAKINLYGKQANPSPFYVYELPLHPKPPKPPK